MAGAVCRQRGVKLRAHTLPQVAELISTGAFVTPRGGGEVSVGARLGGEPLTLPSLLLGPADHLGEERTGCGQVMGRF